MILLLDFVMNTISSFSMCIDKIGSSAKFESARSAWFWYAASHIMKVVSSIPDRGTIVGCVFSPTRQLVRFSHLNVPFFQNSESIWNTVPVGKQ